MKEIEKDIKEEIGRLESKLKTHEDVLETMKKKGNFDKEIIKTLSEEINRLKRVKKILENHLKLKK